MQTFTLYVAGETPLARRAVANFETHIRPAIEGGCELTVVDVIARPQEAMSGRVLATPLLVRTEPPPTLRVVGDFSDADRIAQILLAG